MNTAPKYIQVHPSWDCSLHDRRGDKLPGRLVLDTQWLDRFPEAWEAAKAGVDGVIYRLLAGYLESRYGFAVTGMSFCPVHTRRGIPDMI